AQAIMRKLVRLLSGADIAFKKIDSLLRGHVAAELAECMSHFDHCILAPAFPFQGRITRNRRQLVKSGDDWRDTGVDLEADLRRFGVAARIHDAVTDEDLDQIVSRGRALTGKVLWCGSAGLASALARHLPVPRPSLYQPILALIGSDHPVSAGQLNRLGSVHLPIQAGNIAVPEGNAAVSVEIPAGIPRGQAGRIIANTFSALLTETTSRPGTLVVSGGETLRLLCEELGATGLLVNGQIEPGVPTSLLRGGPWDGQRIVSKSGAFGDPGLLARLLGIQSV
ncbi:MAG: hypothetical protein JO227_24630, partial [Acetobacteraceae bacterium]|nr:hypothetical protein [Acetobacteraceae bacterium]